MKILILVEGATEKYLIYKITDYLNQKNYNKNFINVISYTDQTVSNDDIVYKIIDIHGVNNIIEKSSNFIKDEYQAKNNYDYYFLLADLVDVVKNRPDSSGGNNDSCIDIAENLQSQIKREIIEKIQSFKNLDNLDLFKEIRENNFFIHLQPWLFENLMVAQLDLYFKIYKLAQKKRRDIEKSLNIITPEQNKKSVILENITAKRHGYKKPPQIFIEQCDIDAIASKCKHFKNNLLDNMFEMVLH